MQPVNRSHAREIERAIALVKRSAGDQWMYYLFRGDKAMAKIYRERMQRRREEG
jgi:hypothetical protein